jgi:hypothetical protein
LERIPTGPQIGKKEVFVCLFGPSIIGLIIPMASLRISRGGKE